MTADKARELVSAARNEDYAYNEIINKIKVLAEHGHYRLITDWPGRKIFEKLRDDGYWILDGAVRLSNQCVISW